MKGQTSISFRLTGVPADLVLDEATKAKIMLALKQRDEQTRKALSTSLYSDLDREPS